MKIARNTNGSCTRNTNCDADVGYIKAEHLKVCFMLIVLWIGLFMPSIWANDQLQSGQLHSGQSHSGQFHQTKPHSQQAQLKQVAFNTHWQQAPLTNHQRNEYVRTHYTSAGQLLVLDFELKVRTKTTIKNIDIILEDKLKLSASWRRQIRVGVWQYQKLLHSPEPILNANQLYPVSALNHIVIHPDKALRINVLLWADYSLKLTYALGKLRVNMAKGEDIQTLFAINKLAVSLPLLTAPIGVYEHRFDFARAPNTNNQPLNACVALFAQQLGLKHVIGVGRGYATRRNRLVDIQGAEERFRSRFNQYFNGYPYQQTDLVNHEELARLHHSLSLRQFAYLNQQLQQIYERGLWLPDMAVNEHLWLLMDNKSPQYGEFRSVLGDRQTVDGMSFNLRNARVHPMKNSLVFKETTEFVERLFAKMYNSQVDFSAQGFGQLSYQGKQPWLLNVGHKRAASWFMWRSGVNGYMQWQAQLRANIQNGGEVDSPLDAHFYYLDHYLDENRNKPKDWQQCLDGDGEMLAIDSQWLSLATGSVDRRWLLWLQQLAHDKGPKRQQAQHLLAEISEKTPKSWQQLLDLIDDNPDYLHQLREEIAEFSLR